MCRGGGGKLPNSALWMYNKLMKCKNVEQIQYNKDKHFPNMSNKDCDNILSGYLCAVTTVFSQQDGIYGLKFPKRFLEISSQEISLFSQLFSRS
jgi:hypothetical protein